MVAKYDSFGLWQIGNVLHNVERLLAKVAQE